jgi:uncharacterized protein YjbJ (UPF0337 family)
MSTSTGNKIQGKFDQVAGKVKQSVGEATRNDHLANQGAAQQVKGHVEEAWGSVKEAVNTTATKASASTQPDTARRQGEEKHDVREKLISTAQNVKNHIQDSVSDYRTRHAK